MSRMFLAGAAAALAVSIGVNALTSPAPAAADKSLGMAVMSAVIASNGTLVRGAGAVSATRLAAGSYTVTFNRSLADCSFLGGIGAGKAPGHASGYVIAVNPALELDTVKVRTQAISNGADTDGQFHVQVICGG